MPMTLQQLRDFGFIVDGATKIMDPNKAYDAAPVTAPNAGVPTEFTTFFNPQVVEILTSPRRARAIYPEVIKGDATTSSVRFPLAEAVGHTAPYDDFSNGGSADVNNNWATRDTYLFQTIRRVGDMEEEMSGLARVSLGTGTQRSAALVIDVDVNRFALQGVAGRRIYGLMNDPSLNANITPNSVTPEGGGAAVTDWEKKTSRQIYDDVRKLYAALVNQMGGNDNVTSDGVDDRLVLVCSPGVYAIMGAATDFNVSALDMIKKFLPKLEIVTVPEFSTASGELVQLIQPEFQGQATAEIGATEKFHAFPVVRGLSSYAQKFRAGTCGTLIYRPAAIAGMIGV